MNILEITSQFIPIMISTFAIDRTNEENQYSSLIKQFRSNSKPFGFIPHPIIYYISCLYTYFFSTSINVYIIINAEQQRLLTHYLYRYVRQLNCRFIRMYVSHCSGIGRNQQKFGTLPSGIRRWSSLLIFRSQVILSTFLPAIILEPTNCLLWLSSSVVLNVSKRGLQMVFTFCAQLGWLRCLQLVLSVVSFLYRGIGMMMMFLC